MKRLFFLYALLFLGLAVYSGCGEGMLTQSLGKTETEKKAGCCLPVSWIHYKGEKYVFKKVHSKEDIDFNNLLSTKTFTGEGDGTLPGREIFVDQRTGNLFILDDTGPEEEWAEFTKSEKE